MLVVTIVLYIDRTHTQESLPSIQARLLELNNKYQMIREPDLAMPSRNELLQMKQRVSVINGIVAIRGRSTILILTKMEELLPDGVRINSFHHKKKYGELVIIAASREIEELTTFLDRLEKDKGFSQVLLTRQSPGKNKNEIEFELRLTESPLS